MSDLLVCTHTPVLRTGQTMRTYGVARALAAHKPLQLLYARFGAAEPDEAFRSIPGIELCEVIPSRGLRRMLRYARARLGGVPDGFARGISPELGARAAHLASLLGDGRVIADGPIAAAALTELARERPVIYNAHNIESGFRGEVDRHSRRQARALRAFERGLLERASESWMVSEPDLTAAHKLCPSARVRFVPNVVDAKAIKPASPLTNGRRVLFVASFDYEPNREGLRFMLDEVMPRVWRELPDATLALAGSGLNGAPSGDGRIEALGFVSNLHSAYASAKCVVVPLLHGGGTPLKFVEALAYGVPVVATTRAAAGLAVKNEEHCLIADGADSFAAAVTRVLSSDAARLAACGRELAVERYSIQALSELLRS
jgi:polysaccharide biosynthesis protein PslH